MIVLIARYHVKPGHTESVVAALREMAPLVHEREPGCRLYHVSRAQETADLLVLYEEYEDEASFLGHRETPHFKDIIEGRVVPLLERRERELFNRVIPAP